MRTIERWTGLAADVPDGEGTVAPEVVDALSDDLNTPGAIAVLHRLAGDGQAAGLKASARLLGLMENEEPDGRDRVEGDVKELIERLLKERAIARGDRRFADADSIRDCLVLAGIEIKDGPHGTEWSPTSRFNPNLLEPEFLGGSEVDGGSADGD